MAGLPVGISLPNGNTTPGVEPLPWAELDALAPPEPDRSEGPASAQARWRPFGQPREAVRVVLIRDHHAWCPYCQKVWLWLEERRVPYRVETVSMVCYGSKEAWYTRLVPSGMLPALVLDGRLITESDRILAALEEAFGPLGARLDDPAVQRLRQLERDLFRAWCGWLCGQAPESMAAADYDRRAGSFAAALGTDAGGPWLLRTFSSADVVAIPFLERMQASLLYYKGYDLRGRWPAIDRWFRGLEERPSWRGSRSDHHTHAHDLPPQLGGCCSNGSAEALAWARRIDHGPWDGLNDALGVAGPADAAEALGRVLRHRRTLLQVRPDLGDAALRAALTRLATGRPCAPPAGSAAGLRGLRDRICVPRDMGVLAARTLRQALEDTAALDGDAQGDPLPRRHRHDQDPRPFRPTDPGLPHTGP